MRTVVAAGAAAFEGSSLSDMSGDFSPASLVDVPERFCRDCKMLERIELKKTERILSAAFENCESLHGASFGESLREIGAAAFRGCGSRSGIVVPKTVSRVGAAAFPSALKSVDMKGFSASSVPPSLDDGAFAPSDGLSIFFKDAAAAERFAYDDGWKPYAAYFIPKVAVAVTFDSNSGSGETPPVQVLKGQKWTCPENGFEHDDDHGFVSFNSEKDGSGAEYVPGNEYDAPSADTRLYAVWTTDFIIKFDKNSPNARGRQDDLVIKKGGFGRIPDCSFKKTYSLADNDTFFYRWNTSPSGTGKGYIVGNKITFDRPGSTVLYARWTSFFAISFDGNGESSGSMDSLVVTSNPEKPVRLPANKYKKTFYEFVCWNSKSSGAGTDFDPGWTVNTDVINRSCTMYAKWKAL